MADSGHAQLHELRKGDALMSEQTVSTVTERPDWLDGSTEIELSARHLRAYWDADILDVDDTSIGDGPDFNLSDVLPDRSELQIRDWKGCDGVYIEKYVWVPPETIPVEHCGTLYQVGAKFELRCCGYCEDKDSHVAVAGHEAQGE